MTTFAPTFNGQVRTVAASPDEYAALRRRRLHHRQRRSHRRGSRRSTPRPARCIDRLRAAGQLRRQRHRRDQHDRLRRRRFPGVGNQTAEDLAAFNAVNGALLDWAPAGRPAAAVWALTHQPGRHQVAVGGWFTALNGSATRATAWAWSTPSPARACRSRSTPIVRNGTRRRRHHHARPPTATTSTAAATPSAGPAARCEGIFSRQLGRRRGALGQRLPRRHLRRHADRQVVYAVGHTHYCENIDGVRQGAGGVGDYPYYRATAFSTRRRPAPPPGSRTRAATTASRASRTPPMLQLVPRHQRRHLHRPVAGPLERHRQQRLRRRWAASSPGSTARPAGPGPLRGPSLAPNASGSEPVQHDLPAQRVSSTEAGKVRINWATNTTTTTST